MATPIPTTCGADQDDRPGLDGSVLRIIRPTRAATTPILLASPHSGREYDAELQASTRLPLELLRRSEDAYVDHLIDYAADYGATLLCAEFPRVFVDVNRAAGEIDPAMFADRVPAGEVVPSRRVTLGLGVIPRIGADGRTLYRRRLRFAEARARLDRFYHPYHTALRDEIAALKARFGFAILLDMHSMPVSSSGGADIVLGDRFGTSCAESVSDRVEAALRRLELVTVRNNPYAGGYTTEHYGRPLDGVHVLQIEISRGLYLDETRVRLTPDHAKLTTKLRRFVNDLTQNDWAPQLQP